MKGAIDTAVLDTRGLSRLSDASARAARLVDANGERAVHTFMFVTRFVFHHECASIDLRHSNECVNAA